MDDFIDKIAWGLNIVFSNGHGYPRARYLILDGAPTSRRSRTTCGCTRSDAGLALLVRAAVGREHRQQRPHPGWAAGQGGAEGGAGMAARAVEQARAGRRPGSRRPRLRRAHGRGLPARADRGCGGRRAPGWPASPSSSPARNAGRRDARCRSRSRSDGPAPARPAGRRAGAVLEPVRGGDGEPASQQGARRRRHRRARALGLGRAGRAGRPRAAALRDRQGGAGVARRRGCRLASRPASTSSASSTRPTCAAASPSASATGSRSRSSRACRRRGRAGTTLKFGEFVLGYPNEYGRLTEQLLLDEAAGDRPQRDVPRLPPAAAGRARVLALPSTRRRAAAAIPRAVCGSPRSSSAAGRAGRRSRSRPTPTTPSWPSRTTSATSTATATGPSARSARTSAAPTRATRSTPSRGATSRSRSTAATASCAAAASTGSSCCLPRRRVDRRLATTRSVGSTSSA